MVTRSPGTLPTPFAAPPPLPSSKLDRLQIWQCLGNSLVLVWKWFALGLAYFGIGLPWI